MPCLDKHSPLRRPLASPSRSKVDLFLYILLAWLAASAIFPRYVTAHIVEKYEIAELFIGNLGEREMLEKYTLSEGA